MAESRLLSSPCVCFSLPDVYSERGGSGVESLMDIFLSPFFHALALILALVFFPQTPPDADRQHADIFESVKKQSAAISEIWGIQLPRDLPRLCFMNRQQIDDLLKHARILQESAVMLNKLRQVVERAINAALKPQRDIAARIGCLLPMVPHHDDGTDQPVDGETYRLTYKHHGESPHHDPRDLTFGPYEATSIAWKIGAFLHDPSAARAVIGEYRDDDLIDDDLIDDDLIGDWLDPRIKRRVRAAVDHFVKQAATRTASNREVVGKTERGEGGRPGGVLARWWDRLRGVTGAKGVTGDGQGKLTVRVPALQCFAIHGEGQHPHRRLGVPEVVHRAILDEVAAYRISGVVKGFNSHLSDTDCQFQWGQLGYIDESGCFVSLGIN
ncbi:unnamed protein product [Vitrella brassicaformis CCMP3155]|uniref:Uncharacterized protein n=1 Tax=Vitrella brassicaformis (strain CCMP3155) TaxID=1169540 RepID=A0A0G4FYZ2_VITBC|nr:unnamed protein product [Vitrella brassicaformis CCMP3155]|eukprot:CEM20808.1 unnamed protein product [Vitrella brassicaformis CCMP3155]